MASDAGPTPSARGYNLSIMVMMAAPFLLVGGTVFFLWRASRRGPGGASPPAGDDRR